MRLLCEFSTFQAGHADDDDATTPAPPTPQEVNTLAAYAILDLLQHDFAAGGSKAGRRRLGTVPHMLAHALTVRAGASADGKGGRRGSPCTQAKCSSDFSCVLLYACMRALQVQVLEGQLTLHPGEVLTEKLAVKPLTPGWLRVTGVAWVVEGGATGQALFDVRGKRRKHPKGDRCGREPLRACGILCSKAEQRCTCCFFSLPQCTRLLAHTNTHTHKLHSHARIPHAHNHVHVRLLP